VNRPTKGEGVIMAPVGWWFLVDLKNVGGLPAAS